jgi:hypothetical protein
MDKFNNIEIVTAVIIGISEHLLNWGVPKKYLPIINLVLSIIAAFVYVAPNSPKDAILAALIMALSASGMNVGMKALGNVIRKNKKNN